MCPHLCMQASSKQASTGGVCLPCAEYTSLAAKGALRGPSEWPPTAFKRTVRAWRHLTRQDRLGFLRNGPI